MVIAALFIGEFLDGGPGGDAANRVSSDGFSCHRLIKVQSEGFQSNMNASTDSKIDAFKAAAHR